MIDQKKRVARVLLVPEEINVADQKVTIHR
jgi:hypothetical protein